MNPFDDPWVVRSFAKEIHKREVYDDPRTRVGPVMEPPSDYWEKLATAYLWMRDKGIKHWSERGKA